MQYHPKTELCFRVVSVVNYLQFPIIKLVWNMHNNTNSTYFSHFWSNLCGGANVNFYPEVCKNAFWIIKIWGQIDNLLPNYFALFPALCTFPIQFHSFTPLPHWARCFAHELVCFDKIFQFVFFSDITWTSTCADYERLLTDVFDLILCQISIIFLDFSSQTQSTPSNSEAKRKIQLITRLCKWQKLSQHCQTQAYRYCHSSTAPVHSSVWH